MTRALRTEFGRHAPELILPLDWKATSSGKKNATSQARDDDDDDDD